MSSRYETPLSLKLSLKVSYQCWLLPLYVSAVLILLFMTSLAFSLKLIVLLLIGISGYRQWQQLRSLPGRLIRQDEENWVFVGMDGRTLPVSLQNKSYISRWLIILHFRMPDNKQRSVVILPTMLDADSYRRLSVYLRMTNLKRLTNE